MSFYKKNISIAESRFPELFRSGDQRSAVTFATVNARCGSPVPVAIINSRETAVHSRFDPVKEAGRFISEVILDDMDLYVIFGFGFAYHIEGLLSRLPDSAAVLVIEKEPGLFKAAAEARDLTGLLSDSRFRLLINPGHDDITDALRGRSSRRVKFAVHRGSQQIDPDYYARALDSARSSVSSKEVNIATLSKFEKIWTSNIIRNISILRRSPGINIFFGKFKGIPAVLTAAGPSLEAALPWLRENRNRVLIVAVDTAYRVLIRGGIVPHFCLAVDPQAINARYFEGCGETPTVLIADPTVHPSVFRFFRGRVCLSGVVFDAMKWICSDLPEKGVTAHGGSVSTNAADFIKLTGASPAIMTGQDLAFTEGQAHCRGSYLDEQIFLRSGRFMTPQMFNRRQLTALPKIYVKGIKGGTVQTNQKMVIFMEWFSRRNDPDLINSTEGGALIQGIPYKPLSEISVPEPTQNIFSIINEIYDREAAKAAHDDRSALMKKARLMLSQIESIIPHLSTGAAKSEELASLMKNKMKNRNKIGPILEALDRIDRVIESKTAIRDIIGFTTQRVIHTITEGYEFRTDIKNLSEDEVTALRSKYLYEGLLAGSKFNRRVLAKMTSTLEQGSDPSAE